MFLVLLARKVNANMNNWGAHCLYPPSLSLTRITLTNLPKLTHELSIMKLSSHMEGVRAMASLLKKRMMVWRRYVKIRVSIEMQKLDESLLKMQRMSERIRLLRAQKGREFLRKAMSKIFTHRLGIILWVQRKSFLPLMLKFLQILYRE